MLKDEVAASINVIACICGKDGLISQSEEEKMFEMLVKACPDLTDVIFNQSMDAFFDSEQTMEEYMSVISDSKIQRLTLHISKVSASADGLDFHENVALSKAYMFWGIEPNE